MLALFWPSLFFFGPLFFSNDLSIYPSNLFLYMMILLLLSPILKLSVSIFVFFSFFKTLLSL